MTAAAVGWRVRQNLRGIERLSGRLGDALELSPELTPVDATSLDDTERALRFLQRLDELAGRRQQ